MFRSSFRLKNQLVGSLSVRFKSDGYDYQYLQRSRIPTMHFQRSLPKLPVPKLEETSGRYLSALEPIVSGASLQTTREKLQKFTSGIGAKLQTELIGRDKSNGHTSYITAPWFEMYLTDRKPLPINYNPFLTFQYDERKEYNEQALRTSNLIVSALRFYRSLHENVLEPEVFHMNPKKSDNKSFRNRCALTPPFASWYMAYLHNAYPLDMSQYNNLFNTARIPHIYRDKISFEPAKHISVQYKGKFYTFDVLNESGEIIEPEIIHAGINRILKEGKEAEVPLGIFTTMDRNDWAKTREKLDSLGNEATLKMIDSSLFHVCLDDVDLAGDKYKIIKSGLHLDGKNRWFDKSISIIVTKDGCAAVNFEHSWGDGVAVLRFFEDVMKDSTKNARLHPNSSTSSSPRINNLEFKLDDSIKSTAEKALNDYNTICQSLSVNFLESQGLGKKFCKTHGISPDAVMQMCFQAAFHKQNGTFVATYESASTAAFKHGRTETIRPCTKATQKYSLAVNSRNKPSNQELVGLIKDCSKVHGQLTKEAAMGQGFDRHLYMLKLLSAGNDLKDADIFSDDSYTTMNHNILSTSTLASPAVLAGGFGPVVRDGYGLGYMIKDESMGSLVTTYPGVDGKMFIDCLDHTIKEAVSILIKGKLTQH